MGLVPDLERALARAGFEYLTPIQAESLPIALQGGDVAGQGRTGSGKTLAFLLAIFQRLLTTERNPRGKPNDPRAIVVAPTRELAVQIHKDAESIVGGQEIKLGLAFGGVDYDKQRRRLADGVDVLIGTPGRIIDYFKQHVFTLKAIDVVVLDEADRMFDLGFIADIRFLLRRMPPPGERLGLLFSATLSLRVAELAFEHMNDPVRIDVDGDEKSAPNIRQKVYFPSNEEKIPLLVYLLREASAFRSMVFVNTKVVARRLEDYLRVNGFSVGALSGDLPQKKRLRLLQRFHDGEVEVLVATDVAARGLHIPDVSHVFNYDLPHDAQDYVHRIGRTGRLDAEGDAISFACENYAMSLPDVEAFTGKALERDNLDLTNLPEIKRPARRPPSENQGRGRGRGNSRGRSRRGGSRRT